MSVQYNCTSDSSDGSWVMGHKGHGSIDGSLGTWVTNVTRYQLYLVGHTTHNIHVGLDK